jgi:histidine triad (HIT) family protein
MQFLLNFARSKAGQRLVGWMFAHMNALLPVDRLHETETLLAFHHPKPGYPVHILLVPKKAIANLDDLTASDDEFLLDVFRTTQKLVEVYSLADLGYRLILNAGAYQKVPQLHFHLVAGGGNLGDDV